MTTPTTTGSAAHSAHTSPRLAMGMRARLSFMMFLQFFVWGAWFVTLGTYLAKNLSADGSQISLASMTQSFGAIIAPLIVGLIADRYFAAQKLLGILHIAGGVLLWFAASAPSFGSFFTLALAYMILYMPTLALVNTVSFGQLESPETQFPSIRVFGTIGWIVAGLAIGWLAWEQTGRLELTFKMAAAASLLLGLFSFTLPDTPPAARGQRTSVKKALGLDALGILKSRTYLVFFIASIAICIPLAFYYNFTNLWLNESGVKAAAAVQSLGQFSEALCLLILPLLLRKFGIKWTIAIGMAAWALRYVCFAFGNGGSLFTLTLIGLLLHGVCYDFFFTTGQIYTDKFADESIRSSAQGLVTLATYGVGILIGSLIAGPIVDSFRTAGGHAWTSIWVIPAVIATVVLILFAFFFNDRTPRQDA